MSTIDCPKCGNEHEPAGNRFEDSGELSCESCGFRFVVEVDVEPVYLTRCAIHEYADWEVGMDMECRFCNLCGCCQYRNEVPE